MVARSWATVPSARASASGLDRRHWASSALRTASSTRRSPDSRCSRESRGTAPICSHRSWMPRSADRADRMSDTGSSPWAWSSSCCLASACSRSAASLAENTSARAVKNLSCAARKRFQSSASASRSARPAPFHLRISSRNALVVGPHSVEDDSASASAHRFSLRARTSSRSASSVAKYALRRLVNALRAADSRFHSTASAARSACGAAFHSSSSSRIRSPLLFQCVASAAICSASATIRSLICLACTRACSRAALASSRRWPTSSVSRSRRPRSPSRSPSAFASLMDWISRWTAAAAWAGAMSVAAIRCSSSTTSVSSASYLRW